MGPLRAGCKMSGAYATRTAPRPATIGRSGRSTLELQIATTLTSATKTAALPISPWPVWTTGAAQSQCDQPAASTAEFNSSTTRTRRTLPIIRARSTPEPE